MECERILDLLPFHAGGDLSPGEAAEVDRHLETCARCGVEFAGFRASMSALKDGIEVAVPDQVCADLWEGVKRGLAAERRIRRPVFGSGAARWLAAAAVFVVGLWGGIVAMRATRPPEAPPRGVADRTRPPAEKGATTVAVPARPTAPRKFDLRSVATPVSDRGSLIEVIPAGSDARSYCLDELRVILQDEVSLGY